MRLPHAARGVGAGGPHRRIWEQQRNRVIHPWIRGDAGGGPRLGDWIEEIRGEARRRRGVSDRRPTLGEDFPGRKDHGVHFDPRDRHGRQRAPLRHGTRQVDDFRRRRRRVVAAHCHHARRITIRRRQGQQYRRAGPAIVGINHLGDDAAPGRRSAGDRWIEEPGLRRHAGVKHLAAGKEVQTRIGGRPPRSVKLGAPAEAHIIEFDGIVDCACLRRSRERHGGPIGERGVRRIPSSARHVVHLDEPLGDRVEDRQADRRLRQPHPGHPADAMVGGCSAG